MALRQSTHDGWGMGHLAHILTNRRYMEKVWLKHKSIEHDETSCKVKVKI